MFAGKIKHFHNVDDFLSDMLIFFPFKHGDKGNIQDGENDIKPQAEMRKLLLVNVW